MIERNYASYVRKARKEGKNQDDIESLYGEWGNERDVIDDDIDRLITKRLLTQANKLDIPTPGITDKESWEQGYHGYGSWHLSPKARHELRSQIRKEKNDRSERSRRWITLFIGLIAALTGLIGALIGLLAFLRQ